VFAKGLHKVAFDGNLPEVAAARENAMDFTSVVKGSGLDKETAQARSGYQGKDRTTKNYSQDRRHKVWTAREG
jgi:hypothetical protein